MAFGSSALLFPSTFRCESNERSTLCHLIRWIDKNVLFCSLYLHCALCTFEISSTKQNSYELYRMQWLFRTKACRQTHIQFFASVPFRPRICVKRILSIVFSFRPFLSWKYCGRILAPSSHFLPPFIYLTCSFSVPHCWFRRSRNSHLIYHALFHWYSH